MVSGEVFRRQDRAYIRRKNMECRSAAFDVLIFDNIELQAFVSDVYARVRSASRVFSRIELPEIWCAQSRRVVLS